MRFPLRLSVDFFRAKFSRSATGGQAMPIFRMSPLVTHKRHPERVREASAELEWLSPSECVRLAASQRARVVWMNGVEPMLHPAIGKVASTLVASGRHVFLHTSGAGVRKRMHEFVPLSRLFFCFEFAGLEATHDRFTGQAGSFRMVLEAIRASKLSGFLVCAHVTVVHETDPSEIGELFEFLGARDVDGFLTSSGGLRYPSAECADMTAKLQEIRLHLRCSRWARFSELLEAACAESFPVHQPRKLRGDQVDACQETA